MSSPTSKHQHLLPLAFLMACLMPQAWLGLRWLDIDQRVAPAVAYTMADNYNELVYLVETGQLWGQWTGGFRAVDFFSLSGLAGRWLLGPDPDTLGITVLVLLLAAQLAAYDVARRLGAAWAGVAAALLLPLVPEVAAMARCWSPQVPQMLLLLVALDCLLASRCFTRWAPSLAFALIGILGASFSPMKTHNLLFDLALLGMAGGAWLRGLLLGRGPLPEQQLARWRVAVGGVVVAIAIAAGAWFLHLRYVGLDYFATEMASEAYRTGTPWWHWRSLSAYPRAMFWYTVGPTLAVSALVGLVLYARKGRGRAELLGLLLPLLVLSVLYKKNSYYVSVVYPLVPLLIALGAHTLRWRWLRWTLLSVIVAAAWWSWQARSFADRPPPTVDRLPDSETLFQSLNVPELLPQIHEHSSRAAQLLRPRVTERSCPARTTWCALPHMDASRITLRLLADNPCLRQLSRPDALGCDWVLVWEQGCDGQGMPEVARPLLELGGEPIDLDLSADPCLWLVRQPQERGEAAWPGP